MYYCTRKVRVELRHTSCICAWSLVAFVLSSFLVVVSCLGTDFSHGHEQGALTLKYKPVKDSSALHAVSAKPPRLSWCKVLVDPTAGSKPRAPFFDVHKRPCFNRN